MTQQLDRSARQKRFSPKTIGGSDAAILLSGDAARITRLWQEKSGASAAEDRDHGLQIRMEQWTEAFNRIWFQEQTGRIVTCASEDRLCLAHPWMAATLHGLTDSETTVFEAKHCSAFTKEAEALARSMPRLHHNMIVCGVTKAVLSIFYGNHKHAIYDVALDKRYAASLIAIEKNFWDCLRTGTPPAAPAPVETPEQRLSQRRIARDMAGNNIFASLAAEWKDLKPKAARFEAVSVELKDMIGPATMEATGYGLSIKANRAHALTIREIA